MEYVPFLFFWNFLTCGIDMGLGMGSCGVCLVSLLYLSKRIVYSRFIPVKIYTSEDLKWDAP